MPTDHALYAANGAIATLIFNRPEARNAMTWDMYQALVDACDRADAVLVLTEWQEFVDLDPAELAATVRAKVVVAGRNCLDVDRWQSAGWRVYALGRRIPEVSGPLPAYAPCPSVRRRL